MSHVARFIKWRFCSSCRYYWRRQCQPTPVLLPGKSHGRRSLVGCSPWGCEESDTTERRHFHFSLSCIGEGNGNPLRCSCLENPRDGGARWAAVYGVPQSRTWLKRLSSSSSRYYFFKKWCWVCHTSVWKEECWDQHHCIIRLEKSKQLTGQSFVENLYQGCQCGSELGLKVFK